MVRIDEKKEVRISQRCADEAENVKRKNWKAKVKRYPWAD